jgi:galactitol-specific phosphotransferase system IIB component
MRKSNLIIILTFIFILLLSIYYVKDSNQNSIKEITLSESFKFTGANIISSETYSWGRIEKPYNNYDAAKPIADDILNSLNANRDSSLSIESIDNELLQKVLIKGVSKENLLLEIALQFDKSNENSKGSNVSVKVTEDLSSNKLEETKKTVMNVLSKYNINATVNTCIIGSYEGKLDNAATEEISRAIFKGIDANRVEGIKDGNLISVSAYSPNIEEYIKVNGKKINLNLAIRYNSYENKTYIWLATPVITREY